MLNLIFFIWFLKSSKFHMCWSEFLLNLLSFKSLSVSESSSLSGVKKLFTLFYFLGVVLFSLSAKASPSNSSKLMFFEIPKISIGFICFEKNESYLEPLLKISILLGFFLENHERTSLSVFALNSLTLAFGLVAW